MKIVLRTQQFLPDYRASTEIITYETARELTNRGHDVEVWTRLPADPSIAEKRPFDTYEYLGLKVYRHNHNVLFSGSNPVESEYKKHVSAECFAGYLKENKSDIVNFATK